MSNTVRHAVQADRAEMVRMAQAFHAASGAPIEFDADWCGMAIREHIESSGLALILEVDGAVRGMLCAVAVRSSMAPVNIASEIVFWIDEGARGRSAGSVIAAYEQWARDQRCAVVGLATLQDMPAGKLYERRGYRPAELHYMKVL